MLASGSGPLGALLMIAPLAAIPVFAIVGLPQFSPMVASATDEEEIVPDRDSRAAVSRSHERKPRSADDLFTPVGSQTPEIFGNHRKSTERNQGSDLSRSPGGSRLNRQHMPDLSELDESWEVIPDSLEQIDTLPGRSKPDLATLPDSFDDPRGSAPSKATIRPAPQRRPDSESSYGVPADQFSPDLIHPGPPAGQPKKLHSQEKTSPPDAGARSQNQNPKMRIAPRRRPEGEPVEGQPEAMEQSRWQAAANRLKDLGIHKYRLSWNFERQKFLFCCILPSSDGSEVSDLFDADADTPLDAVETVVGQINEWLQQGRPSTSVPPN